MGGLARLVGGLRGRRTALRRAQAELAEERAWRLLLQQQVAELTREVLILRSAAAGQDDATVVPLRRAG